MTLSPGTKLGPYEILSPLGAGGMGEVFRARDTRLGRDVAVKVLPQHLSAHPEVRARFEREARTVSSLNHPNICTLFDVGREGDTDYLVMELIEGETLAARLDKGPLPAADALRVGSQVADALDRAHRAGIVHRDLKPGNIMLTKTGAKLMDFGLARVTGLSGAPGSGVSIGALTQSPTMAHPLTAEGTIVGTFQYMSPEQLEGKEADERADIWALGCVLYEMATGKRPFDGSSQASLITSIMGSQPTPISQVAPLSPPALDHLVTACLAKDPADRVQSAHDVKLQLAWIAQGGSDVAAPKAIVKRRRNRAALAWALALIPALVAGALIRDVTKQPEPAPVIRSALLPPVGVRLETTGDESGPPVISPDGSMVVFSAVGGGAGKRLWLRRLDTFEARPLPGTDDASYPFWSPDSRNVAFFVPGAMRRIDVEQETIVTVVPLDANPRGGAWSKDGVIVYSRSYLGALYRVAATGGESTVATPFDSTRESTHRFPYCLPDGRHFIYLSANHRDPTGNSSAIYFASLDGGDPKRVLASKSNAIYADGFLFFVQDSTLMAQPFNPETGETIGTPRATRETVQIDRSTWRMPATVSDNGTLVYAAGGGTGNNRVSVFDRSGNVEKHLTDFGTILNTASSSDGRRVVYELQVLPLADMWVVDRVSGTRSRITTHPDDETLPCFSPDDRYILYAGRHRGDHYQIYRMRADGSGAEELVLAADSVDAWPVGESPDGRWLVYGRGVASGIQHGSLHVAALPAGNPSRMLVPDLDNVANASLSPDGRWLAYSAGVSGRLEIYVSPFRPESSGTPARWQVSARGGECPRWRGDGREMYYSRADGTVVAATVDGSGADFRVDGEKSLFQVFQRPLIASLCVTPDGQTFVINQLGGSSVAPLALVTNWTATLETR